MERRQLIKLVIPSALVIIVSILTMKFSPSETLVPLPAPVSNLSNLTNSSGVEIIAEGLQAPRSIDISKDGRIFVSEKRGSIRVVDNGTLLTEPVGDIKAENIGDAGLLGLTLHPNFTQNHLFYVYYTYSNSTGLFNKILMLTESNNRIIDSKTILDGIPGDEYRDGGRIKFGPDGKLYVYNGMLQFQNYRRTWILWQEKYFVLTKMELSRKTTPFPIHLFMHMVLGMSKD